VGQYRPPEWFTARARRLRNNPTDAESAIWYVLRENFPEERFRRQVPIRSFIVDFASHRSRIVIEIDGGQHGGKSDLERTALIEAEGYRVIRFWNNDALGNPERVATAIAGALHEHHPHPTLPHQGGGIHGDNSKWHG